MASALLHKLHLALEKRLPERRLFLRSDTETRFIRLRSSTQLIALVGVTAVGAWTLVATSILLMDSLSSGNIREQVKRDQFMYEAQLNKLSAERDMRAQEAASAHMRFSVALEEISDMQERLLASEDKRREVETGLEVVQTTLRDAIKERDLARKAAEELQLALAETEAAEPETHRLAEVENTVAFLSEALRDTASERDHMQAYATDADDYIAELRLESRLKDERNDLIFSKLEEAMTVSIAPMDKMFRNAGLNVDNLIDQVRRGYSGQGGPLTPLEFTVTDGEEDVAEGMRANSILERLDEMNIYRIAASKAPFDVPVKSAFRFTSGFGPRWGRMHNGTDFAASYGTPIYATGDGVVIHAGWQSGYGRLVKIQHEFGIETRYAHMAKIRVSKGQRVSRGDRIGDMGNSGRSTGTHLHYEVRVGGKPVNPMNYIKAARDVF
ncbi:M23 family metallopeptidase [Pseudoruegeria sp. SHC-113]|uniref:M23 family metallopeptidase n=1 Tax=Pseudoruegeria sp. SHC-113 TaxID=2855439 RepID=UPI0021BB31D2|nr:M23 family metallopeptidase [Pseudoruegeria sp. SHC-113]